jgi:GABA(A) receptor-associated protein
MNPPSVKSDEIKKLRAKYPDRIPIFLIKDKSTNVSIVKSKFLVPGTLTFGEFIYNIRRLYKLKPEEALYFYINGVLPNNGELISIVHDKCKGADGALHVVYSAENTFG